MTVSARRLLIGVSPRIMRNLPPEFGFRGKTLQYLEQSVAHWVMAAGAMVAMVPTTDDRSEVREDDLSVDDYAASLHGLILQGGADIDPGAYGEAPTEHLQLTDPVRDRFELRLLRAFVRADRPVFGICRGMQLINVAYGGSLYQDLQAAGAAAAAHHVPTSYDEHAHPLRIAPGSWLASLYPGVDEPVVNSIHHQGIKRLGDGLRVEAWSEDHVAEFVRAEHARFVVGVQWHPEFHDERFPELLPGEPLLEAFLAAAARAALDDGLRPAR